MKELLDFCVTEIDLSESILQPYYAKYEVKNSFELMNLVNSKPIATEDSAEIFYQLGRKHSYVSLINTHLMGYEPGVMGTDTDVDAKRRFIFNSASVIMDRASGNNIATWERLNKVPSTTHLEHVTQCILASELEFAAMGLMYLIYQKHFEKTNRADKKLADPFYEEDQPTPPTEPQPEPPEPPLEAA